MFNRKTLFPLTVIAAIAALLTFVAVRGWQHAHASPPAAQTNLRKIKIFSGGNPPIEVTKILWDGATVEPDSGIPSGGDWIANLQVHFKNVSDKPISYAKIMIFDKRPTIGTLAMVYGQEYETDPTKPTIAPNEYGVARPDLAMWGRTTGESALEIQVSQVIWNFDHDFYWSAGELWERDKSPNAPQKYKRVIPLPTPTPQAGSRTGHHSPKRGLR
ncbi:MAG TPA: hypothetical protein VIQ24_02990 [Pyrinomonadaceae bacterium]